MFGNLYIQILKNEQKIQVLKNVSQDFIEEIKSQEEEVKSWAEGDFKLKLVNVQKYLDELLKDPNLNDDKK